MPVFEKIPKELMEGFKGELQNWFHLSNYCHEERLKFFNFTTLETRRFRYFTETSNTLPFTGLPELVPCSP
jgi:hypothetical protein